MQRQIETRMRIVDALERMMKSSAIDRIKVTDLCKWPYYVLRLFRKRVCGCNVDVRAPAAGIAVHDR